MTNLNVIVKNNNHKADKKECPFENEARKKKEK